jgi:hypothetical protein
MVSELVENLYWKNHGAGERGGKPALEDADLRRHFAFHELYAGVGCFYSRNALCRRYFG